MKTLTFLCTFIFLITTSHASLIFPEQFDHDGPRGRLTSGDFELFFEDGVDTGPWGKSCSLSPRKGKESLIKEIDIYEHEQEGIKIYVDLKPEGEEISETLYEKLKGLNIDNVHINNTTFEVTGSEIISAFLNVLLDSQIIPEDLVHKILNICAVERE